MTPNIKSKSDLLKTGIACTVRSSSFPSAPQRRGSMTPAHGRNSRPLITERDGPQQNEFKTYNYPANGLPAQSSTHIGASTSKTMELAWIQAWSSGSRLATELCHLLDARTSRFCLRKTV